MLGAERARQRRRFAGGQDPLHVGVRRGIDGDERAPHGLEQAVSDRTVHIREQTRIPSQVTEQRPREEKPEEQPPAGRAMRPIALRLAHAGPLSSTC